MTLDFKILPFGLHPWEDTAGPGPPGSWLLTHREGGQRSRTSPFQTEAADPSQESWAASHPPPAPIGCPLFQVSLWGLESQVLFLEMFILTPLLPFSTSQ